VILAARIWHLIQTAPLMANSTKAGNRNRIEVAANRT
jgi:hypothetical protein